MKGRGALLALSLVMLVAAKPPMRYQPDPSSVIAAEIAFNRLAQKKGQWTAFRETAADDAVMFVPQRVVAKDWLKKQADPPASVSWSPSIVYVSCDAATLARDLAVLVDGGFSIESLRGFDLFPLTAHLESVTVLRR